MAIANVPSSGSASNLDLAGNGLTVVQDYLTNTNPTDYYQGNTPTITFQNQSGNSGPNGSVTVLVTSSSGTPLSNAPVTFTDPSGNQTLSLSPNGNTLTYPNDGSLPSPPYLPNTAFYDPDVEPSDTTKNSLHSTAIGGTFPDIQYPPNDSLQPGMFSVIVNTVLAKASTAIYNVLTGSHLYGFHDFILDPTANNDELGWLTGTFENPNDPIQIVRTVAQRGQNGAWQYTIQKSGISSSVLLP